MSHARFSDHRVRHLRRAATLAVALSVLAACGDDYDDDAPTAPLPASTVFSATGDVTAKLTEFRAALGEPNNAGAAGQQQGGRRELNWDGVPALRTNTDDFPADFFNVTSPRGIITTSVGSGLRVSDNDFGDINADYDAQFEQFSGQRTFMSVGSNALDATFRVAGTTQVAAVKGFGVVFSDVDQAGSARIELYDATDRLIAQAQAPVRSDAQGFSFVGVTFQSAIVTRVRVISGKGALGSAVKDVTAGGALDLVVMDDFLYSEPVAP